MLHVFLVVLPWLEAKTKILKDWLFSSLWWVCFPPLAPSSPPLLPPPSSHLTRKPHLGTHRHTHTQSTTGSTSLNLLATSLWWWKQAEVGLFKTSHYFGARALRLFAGNLSRGWCVTGRWLRLEVDLKQRPNESSVFWLAWPELEIPPPQPLERIFHLFFGPWSWKEARLFSHVSRTFCYQDPNPSNCNGPPLCKPVVVISEHRLRLDSWMASLLDLSWAFHIADRQSWFWFLSCIFIRKRYPRGGGGRGVFLNPEKCLNGSFIYLVKETLLYRGFYISHDIQYFGILVLARSLIRNACSLIINLWPKRRASNKLFRRVMEWVDFRSLAQVFSYLVLLLKKYSQCTIILTCFVVLWIL